jgi:UTP--glucose-1-phosphate uridylyltransferase
MTVTKAVIPAAGLGTRFLPFTKASPKEMLPLIDRPAIQHVVEEAVRCGLEDILIVTGRGKGSIEDHFDRAPELEAALERGGKTDALKEVRALADLADIHFIRQDEPRGLGHAVGVARRHVGHEPFVVMLGDDIMHERSGVLEGMLAAHERHQASVVAFKEVSPEEISSYGCAAAEPVEEHLVLLRDIVEKPDPSVAPSLLAVMGRYVLTPEIFDLIERTDPGKGGEIQLTDAIKALMADQPVYGYTFKEGRFDVGNKQDYLRAVVELALEREDLGPGLLSYLRERLGAAGA